MNEEKFRCHFSIVLEKTYVLIGLITLITLKDLGNLRKLLENGIDKEKLIILLIGLIILTIDFIYNILVWSKTFIKIEENTIVVQKNTMNSKVNTFGIKNIANINLEQNIFERIMGTYKIKIDTDSLTTSDSTDIEIVLKKEKAYEFKNKVISIMNNETINDDYNENDQIEKSYKDYEEETDYDIVYSTEDVIKHCFYSMSISGILFSIVMLVASVYMFFVEGSNEKGIIGIILLVSTGIISLIKFLVGDLFKYYNFSVKRVGNKLNVSSGLIELKKYTIPLNRVNAINIKQTLISRLFNMYQCEIEIVGIGDEKDEGSQILLCQNKKDFLKNIKTLIPEIDVEDMFKMQKESRYNIIIRIKNIILLTLLYALILYCISSFKTPISNKIFIYIGIGLFVLTVVINFMSHKSCGFYLGKDDLFVSNGIFTKKVSIVKYKKIQYVDINQSPLGKIYNICKGNIHILASLGRDEITIGYYNKRLFKQLKRKVIKSN